MAATAQRPLKLLTASPNEVRRFGNGDYLHPLATSFARRRTAQLARDRGTTTPSATWSSFGFPAAMTFDALGTGTNTNGDQATGPAELVQTGTTLGDSAGRLTSIAVTQRGWNPTLASCVLTNSSAQSIGEWWGWTDVDPSGVDAFTTQSVAVFVFNTAAGHSATWRAVTCDGAGTPTVTNGSVSRTNSTRWWSVIELDDPAGEVRFWITDSTGAFVNIATHNAGAGAKIPAQTTALKLGFGVTTKSGASVFKRFSADFFRLEQD